MGNFHKKMLFLDMILFLVIIILAVTENTNIATVSGDLLAAWLLDNSEREEQIEPYKELRKKVAITFDDGPDPQYTPMLLDGLKERNVQATFFVLGEQVKLYPEIVKRMYEEGHLIGTHSYEHVNLSRLSDAKAMEQINKTNRLIFDITGENPQYIRPPFGCSKCNLEYKTKMIEVLWDIDPLDWKNSSSEEIAKRVVNKVQEYDIILLHDASESSVLAAFKIVDRLKEEGYEFVTVEDIVVE